MSSWESLQSRESMQEETEKRWCMSGIIVFPFYSQKERSMVSFSTTIGQLFSARTHKIANCNKKWNSRMVKFVIKAAKGPRWCS